MAKNIKNLVFEGGGVKGAAYAGAISVLDENGLYETIQSTAGTSAGSITATILACGADSQGLLHNATETNFNDFIYDVGGLVGDAIRFKEFYGIHTGKGFVKILKEQIKNTTDNPDITFSNLHELSIKNTQFKDLFIVATNLSKQKAQTFSHIDSPDLEIWKAVRASISIPFIFEPFKINDDYFIDGGLSWNYPIDLFDHQGFDFNQTLGFFLEPHSMFTEEKSIVSHYQDIHSMKSFVESIGTFMFESSNSKHIQENDKKRTVFIDDLNFSATDFDINQKQTLELVESGKRSMSDYLNGHS